MEKHFQWHGWDDPRVVNDATVTFLPAGLRARGTQTARAYAAEWSLDAADDWITHRLQVWVSGDGWARSLDLRRSPEGEWSARVDSSGRQPRDLGEAGIPDGVDLADALDCDLGLCPLTNTMPIRRLGLQSGLPGARRSLVMAWVDMPSLRVAASPQTYTSRSADSVVYGSGNSGESWLLTVDGDGIVVDYPELARRAR